MIQAVESIRRSIVVPAPPERAFEVFTSGMTSWWPAAHHIGSAPIAEIVIEPFAGGRWYTRHEDGSETSTGFVVAWEPPSRLVITWQIGSDWRYDPALITTVEVTFTAEDSGGTRVVAGAPRPRPLRAGGRADARDVQRAGRLDGDAERLRGGLRRVRYVLFYESGDAVAVNAPPHFPAHFERIKAFHARGELLLVGTFGDPQAQGSMGVFTSREAAESFVAEDPFLLNGVVASYEIREWNEILGSP